MSQCGAYGFAKHGKRLQADPPPLLHGREHRQAKTKQRPGAAHDRAELDRLQRRQAGLREGPRRERDLLVPRSTGERDAPAGRTARKLAAAARGSAKGGGSVRFDGVGAYRGDLVAREASGARSTSINKVEIDDYVQGVIPDESPATGRTTRCGRRRSRLAPTRWRPASAATATTTTTTPEARSTAAAVETSAPTARPRRPPRGHQVPAATSATAFFFSTSGGRTENIEFGFRAAVRASLSEGVNDPYDDASPTTAGACASPRRRSSRRSSGLFGATSRGSDHEAGRSPRIVEAKVVGSRLHDRDRRHPALPPRPALDLGEVQEARPAQPSANGWSGDAVVGVAGAELVDRRARDLEASVLLAGPLDLQLEVGDRAVERVVLGPAGVGVDPGDEVLRRARRRCPCTLTFLPGT